jgi:hypothetical protein
MIYTIVGVLLMFVFSLVTPRKGGPNDFMGRK